MVLAADFGVGQVLWSIFWFFLFFMWIWLVISIFGDLIRAKDMSGWTKAIWTLFIIVVPFLGVLAYLVVNGGKMSERAVAQAEQSEAAFRSYVQEAAGTGPSKADQLEKLAALRERGAIDEAEFQRLKADVVGS